jgi:hypothetical protein
MRSKPGLLAIAEGGTVFLDEKANFLSIAERNCCALSKRKRSVRSAARTGFLMQSHIPQRR